MKTNTLNFVTFLFLVTTSFTRIFAGPYDLFYSGRFTDETGKPIEGPVKVEVKFFVTIQLR